MCKKNCTWEKIRTCKKSKNAHTKNIECSKKPKINKQQRS